MLFPVACGDSISGAGGVGGSFFSEDGDFDSFASSNTFEIPELLNNIER